MTALRRGRRSGAPVAVGLLWIMFTLNGAVRATPISLLKCRWRFRPAASPIARHIFLGMTEKPPEQAKADAQAPSPDEADVRAYRVSLPMFEGPLDLLLHLIQKHELDILDIPIGFISQKYVEYIGMMEELSIDIASEYLLMAATLAHIKSRSLLPPDPTQEAEDDVLEEEEDPRTELIRRLLEYQKYKHAADSLGGREVLGRDVFGRGLATEPSAEEAPLAPLSLFKLIDAFEGVLKRAKQVEEHQVNFERISISERIGQIVDRLRLRGSLRFEQLFDGDISRADMIVTFLALLEMTKLRLTYLTQEGPLEPITVELAVADNERHEFEDERDGEKLAFDQGGLGAELTPSGEHVELTPSDEHVELTPQDEHAELTPQDEDVELTPKDEHVEPTLPNGDVEHTPSDEDAELTPSDEDVEHRVVLEDENRMTGVDMLSGGLPPPSEPASHDEPSRRSSTQTQRTETSAPEQASSPDAEVTGESDLRGDNDLPPAVD